MNRHLARSIRAAFAATLLAGLTTTLAPAVSAQTLTIDAATGQHAIKPDIYGMAYGPGITPPDTSFAKRIQLPSLRWGGDDATRYNWQVDSSNSGFDYFFIGGANSGTEGGSVDTMITTYAYSHALVTIPIIPWINKGAATSCSFRVSVYGAQQQEKSGVLTGDECGNSLQTNGTQLLDNDITYNHVANSTAIQQSWVSHLVSKFGTAAKGGVSYYQLDNEPGGWSNTHRDVEPKQPDYGTLVSLGEQYATAIKAADSTAKVLGPSDFQQYGWVVNAPSGTSIYSGQYYLQQFAAYDAKNGSRSLDYFDEHYVVGASSSAADSFNQVRTWWDPTYDSGSSFEGYLKGPIQAIPRFRSWIAQYYPGTGLTISEYELESTGDALVDALVETDALGVFGYQGLDLAALFGAPDPTSPVAYAFLLYRNYDGKGGAFGDTSVTSTSADQTKLSIYGALRSSDGALTVIVINKTTADIATTLTLSNFASEAAGAAYLYSNSNLSAIVAGSPATVTGGNTVSRTFPAYSATELVFPRAGGASDAGSSGGSSDSGSGSGSGGSSSGSSGSSSGGSGSGSGSIDGGSGGSGGSSGAVSSGADGGEGSGSGQSSGCGCFVARRTNSLGEGAMGLGGLALAIMWIRRRREVSSSTRTTYGERASGRRRHQTRDYAVPSESSRDRIR